MLSILDLMIFRLYILRFKLTFDAVIINIYNITISHSYQINTTIVYFEILVLIKIIMGVGSK